MSAAAVALETLREHCSPEQRASLDAYQRFEAVGASGKRYMISWSGDQVWVQSNNTRPMAASLRWTATVRARYHHLPAADCALLAKLAIEADEEHWKAMAYMCGNVYVEDMTPAMEAQQAAAAAALQLAITEQQRLHQLQQAGQLPVGTLYRTPGGQLHTWNGQQWILQQ